MESWVWYIINGGVILLGMVLIVLALLFKKKWIWLALIPLAVILAVAVCRLVLLGVASPNLPDSMSDVISDVDHNSTSVQTTTTTVAAEEAYWITFSHPLSAYEATLDQGGYRLETYFAQQLKDIVSRLEWYGEDVMADTDFGAQAVFTFNKNVYYYVNLRGQEMFDGVRMANLSQDDVNTLDYLLREGTPRDKVTHHLTGTMIEWSKAQQYILLEITQADSADLVGKKIMVSTQYVVGSIPVIGTPVQVGYDGTVDGDTVYALVIQGEDADFLGSPDDDNTANTFTGKVLQIDDGKMLMECYDTDKFASVWVHFSSVPGFTPVVGAEYVVIHSDVVMMSYPPQVTAERITPVSSTPLQ